MMRPFPTTSTPSVLYNRYKTMWIYTPALLLAFREIPLKITSSYMDTNVLYIRYITIQSGLGWTPHNTKVSLPKLTENVSFTSNCVQKRTQRLNFAPQHHKQLNTASTCNKLASTQFLIESGKFEYSPMEPWHKKPTRAYLGFAWPCCLLRRWNSL